jgi:hypothetical protein
MARLLALMIIEHKKTSNKLLVSILRKNSIIIFYSGYPCLRPSGQP